jgi:CubicO group peptidase (beta-lactamase class C family)
MNLDCPQVIELIQHGIERRLHTGVQLSFNLRGNIVDLAYGQATPEMTMTPDSILMWLSAAKPLTVLALAQLVEQRQLDWNESLFKYFPEWHNDTAKSDLTLWHLLTHTAGLVEIETGWPELPWDEVLDRVLAAPLVSENAPGHVAAYSPQVNWVIAAELMERVVGATYREIMLETVLAPLGMDETDCVRHQSPELLARYGNMYERVRGELTPDVMQQRIDSAVPNAGSSYRGPARDLRKFYDLMNNQGQPLIQPETFHEITRRQRIGMFDQTLQHIVDYGLGVIVNSNRYGAQTIPYGYGPYCSEETFGHAGSQSSSGFADPGNQLSVVMIANGRPGEGQHQRRFRELLTALYQDLGLAETV